MSKYTETMARRRARMIMLIACLIAISAVIGVRAGLKWANAHDREHSLFIQYADQMESQE